MKWQRILIFFCCVLTSFVFADINIFAEDIYRVGVNDLIEIRVLGNDELKTLTAVSSDGTITFPYIGVINVKGMKLSEIEELVTKKLSEGYVKYPVVSVSLIKSLSRKILVYSEAGGSGEVIFEEGMTVLSALSLRGGISERGIYGKVKVRRKQQGKSEYKDIEIDLRGTVEGNVKGGDVLLQPDDIVIVERNKTFFIQGEVNKIGEFVLEKDMTLARAIAAAGGVGENGLYGKLIVKRRDNEKLQYKDVVEIALNKGVIDVGGDILLQPDDIVIIERNKTFFVYGEVRGPGEYVLTEDTTVTKAISKAGGVTLDSLYGKVKVRRKQEGEPGYRDIKINLQGTIEGSLTGDMMIQPDDIVIVERNKTFFVYGEVNRPGQFVLEDDMTVFKAISLAGGFTKWGSPRRVEILRQTDDGTGYTKAKINIDDIIKGKAPDILLKPGDTIVVSAGVF